MIKRIKIPLPFTLSCVAFEKSVGAVVFRVTQKGREFLFMKYRSGHWEFPRGRAEEGETELETMQREIEEETGLSQLKILPNFRKVIRFSYKAHGHEYDLRVKNDCCVYVHKKVIFYLVEALDEDIIISDEHQQFRWLPFEEGYKLLTFSGAKKVLKAANKYFG